MCLTLTYPQQQAVPTGAQATQVPPLPAVLQACRAAGDEAPAEKK